MSNPRIRSLFHTLVVVGASVSGCGGKSSSASGNDELTEAGAGSGGRGGVGGWAGAAGSAVAAMGGSAAGAPEGPFTNCVPSQWKCDSYFPEIGCHCDASRPQGASSCDSPFDFTCDWEATSAGIPYGIGCSCQASSSTPDDCDTPEHFRCTHYGNFFANCGCDATAPVTAADCEEAWCTEFRCASESPRYACTCFHLGCIK